MNNKRYIEALDGMRGVAACCVVFMHIGERWGLYHYPRHAYLAVPFFFVLSGFVIANAYEQKLKDGMTLKSFFEIRTIRLYPSLFIALLIAFMLGEKALWIVMGLAMIPNIFGTLFPADGPEWSLLYEVLANALHAALLPILTTRNLVIVVILTGIGTIGGAFRNGGLEVGWSSENAFTGILVLIFSYSTGIVIYRLQAACLRLPVRMPLVVLAAIYLCAIGLPQATATPASAVRDILVTILVFPVLVWMLTVTAVPAFAARSNKLLGDLSYPVYIVHHPLVVAAAPLVLHIPDQARTIVGVGFTIGCAAISLAILHFADQPIRRRLTCILQNRKATSS